MRELPKIRGATLEVPIIRTMVLGSILGSLPFWETTMLDWRQATSLPQAPYRIPLLVVSRKWNRKSKLLYAGRKGNRK